MRFGHLGLAVADIGRSRRFYETYFGFDPATAQWYEDGTLIVRDADSFDLALHTVDAIGELPAFLHFGFRLPAASEVRELLARLAADGVRMVESDDEPGHVSFKALDPDGYRVEVYWEPR